MHECRIHWVSKFCTFFLLMRRESGDSSEPTKDGFCCLLVLGYGIELVISSAEPTSHRCLFGSDFVFWPLIHLVITQPHHAELTEVREPSYNTGSSSSSLRSLRICQVR